MAQYEHILLQKVLSVKLYKIFENLERKYSTMRKGENYNTGCEPNQRPKNKKNGKKRVAHVAAVVAFLNKAKADENK